MADNSHKNPHVVENFDDVSFIEIALESVRVSVVGGRGGGVLFIFYVRNSFLVSKLN